MDKNLFTERELEVLALLKKAKQRKHVADDLGISIHTVNAHIRSLHLKTRTHSLPELIIWKEKIVLP